ncbi:hypothetical protein Tco_0515171, partial [Tanacetum coccineum]
VMAISVISISSDSSEDSVGTPIGREILFGTIPTTIPDTTPVVTPPATQTDTPVIPTETPIIAPTIPPSPDYTPASPDYSPASDSESDPSEDPSSDHIPPLPATSPFLSSDDDPTDSDTPDTPSSPTHDTPFTEITASTQRSPIIPRRRVMLLAPGQPIPHGRPYRYHLNGPVHMMTARKRVGPLPTHHLVVRHSTDHSSSDSSSEASSDFHLDASSDPSSRHSLSDHSSPDLPGTSAGLSRKRRRSPMTSVPALSPVSGALSPVRADLIPSPKRVRDSGYLAEVEVDPRETSLRDDVIVGVSDEPHLEQDSDPEVQAEIDECFAYADALRDRGIDARVVVETIDRDETETGVRGPVEVRVERVTHPVMPEDIPEPAQEGSVEVTYETLGDLVQRFHDHTQAIPVHRIQTIEGVQREQGHRIVGVESAVIALTERLAELERDNRRLRGTMSVESQRVDRLQRGMSRMQRELRQMRRLRFYDRVRVGRLEACARKHMGYRSCIAWMSLLDLCEVYLPGSVIAISVLSDSSEDSVGTPARRVILFGTIPTTISDTTPVITPPITQTDTTVIPTEIPITAPTIPPSPDYTPSSPDYSHASEPESDLSSDHIPSLPATSPFLSSTNDTTDSDTPSSPTHDFHSDASFDSSSRHLLSNHSSPDLPSTSVGPSRKRCRSPMTYVPALPLVSGTLSTVRVDLIPSPKRIRDSGYLADVEVDPRETSLRDDVIDREIDARVIVEVVDRVGSETDVRGPVEVRVDRVTHTAKLCSLSSHKWRNRREKRYSREVKGETYRKTH